MENGYANSSLSSTAARIGLTKGAFAYHFPTKADLVAAMAQIADEHVAEADAVAGLLYPGGGLREYLVYDRITGESFTTDPVVRAMNVMLFDPTAPAALVDEVVSDRAGRFRRYLVAARELGELDLDAERVDATVDFLVMLSLGAGFLIGRQRMDPVDDYGSLQLALQGLGMSFEGVDVEVVERLDEHRQGSPVP